MAHRSVGHQVGQAHIIGDVRVVSLVARSRGP